MQSPSRPGWWSRNWKWFVPTGCCLGTLVTGLLLVALFGVGIFGLFSGISKVMKSSEPYQTAVQRATADEKVIAALGTPISEGFPMGSVNTSGESGDVDLSIPIAGPKGKATIYVVGKKFAGRWTYSKLSVKIASTGEMIDLEP